MALSMVGSVVKIVCCQWGWVVSIPDLFDSVTHWCFALVAVENGFQHPSFVRDAVVVFYRVANLLPV